MKRLLTVILLCSVLLLSSCAEEEIPEISLSTENIREYVAVNLSFGDIAAEESDSGGYYLSCICYIDIVPTGDYKFDSASIGYNLPSTSDWKAVEVNGSENDWEIKTTHNTLNASIKLDKDGYGSTRVYLYCYSSSIEKMHPTQRGEWSLDIQGVSGTVVG